MNTHKNKRVTLLCDCKAPGHIVEFECDDDPVAPVLYIWPKLNFHLPFFKRVANAVCYALRIETGWCDFEEIVVRDVETAEKIIAVCHDFIAAMGHRVSEEERQKKLKKAIEQIKHDHETLNRWAARLAEATRRTEEDVIENGLRAENFTGDYRLVVHMLDGSTLIFNHAFSLDDDNEIVVFTEHNGHHSFPRSSVVEVEHRQGID